MTKHEEFCNIANEMLNNRSKVKDEDITVNGLVFNSKVKCSVDIIDHGYGIMRFNISNAKIISLNNISICFNDNDNNFVNIEIERYKKYRHFTISTLNDMNYNKIIEFTEEL